MTSAWRPRARSRSSPPRSSAFVTSGSGRSRSSRPPTAAPASGAEGFSWFGIFDDETFASSGHKAVADRLYAKAGVTSQDIDVALIYDHFTPMVLMQLEEYGFCEKAREVRSCSAARSDTTPSANRAASRS